MYIVSTPVTPEIWDIVQKRDKSTTNVVVNEAGSVFYGKKYICYIGDI